MTTAAPLPPPPSSSDIAPVKALNGKLAELAEKLLNRAQDDDDDDNTGDNSSEDASEEASEEEDEGEKSEREDEDLDLLHLLKSTNLYTPQPIQTRRTDVFTEPPTLEAVAHNIKSGKHSKIVVLTGAGVSVAAGIPDFRTPGTGLYSNLAKYDLPHPSAVFDIGFYKSNPKPFVMLASEIWPGKHLPTMTHAFITLLERRKLLCRNYTQNIDGLEVIGGLNPKSVIECHGHFRSASCIKCSSPQSIEECSSSIFKGNAPLCSRCGSLTKPDIVFFGEDLTEIFHKNIAKDCKDADLLIVIGTSLLVNPVASIPSFVGGGVPRVLLNRECAGEWCRWENEGESEGSMNYRDVYLEGDCDESCLKFCELLGEDWVVELKEIYAMVAGRNEGGIEGVEEVEKEEVD